MNGKGENWGLLGNAEQQGEIAGGLGGTGGKMQTVRTTGYLMVAWWIESNGHWRSYTSPRLLEAEDIAGRNAQTSLVWTRWDFTTDLIRQFAAGAAR